MDGISFEVSHPLNKVILEGQRETKWRREKSANEQHPGDLLRRDEQEKVQLQRSGQCDQI